MILQATRQMTGIEHCQRPVIALRSALLLALLVCQGGVPRADEPVAAGALDAQTLTAVKRATVFVGVKSTKAESSGSGFVIAGEEQRLLIATNSHVVGLMRVPDALPGRSIGLPRTVRQTAAAAEKNQIKIVFGSGSADEHSSTGKLLAYDPDVDLAIIEVPTFRGCPKPMDYSQPPSLVETMPVYVFGFPFGQLLSESKDSNPALTVGRASVSSMRYGDHGALKSIQIDGALNPGNSGGPIINSAGKLIGVAVARIKGGDNIGLAIPAQMLPPMLLGRTGKGELGIKQSDDSRSVSVAVEMVDPLQKLGDLTFVYAIVGTNVKPDTKMDLLADPQHKTLKLAKERFLATVLIELAKSDEGKQMLWQVVRNDSSGKQIASAVETRSLAPVTTAVARAGGPNQGIKPPGTPPAVPPLQSQDVSPGPLLPSMLPTAGDESLLIGGGSSPRFRAPGPPGALLVGIEIGPGQFLQQPILDVARPIFLKDGVETRGAWHAAEPAGDTTEIIAKPGYAVGGVTAEAHVAITALSVTFMRIKGDKLDPGDKYESPWFGTRRLHGAQQWSFKSDGRPAIGLIGREQNNKCVGIGFLLGGKPTAIVAPPAPAIVGPPVTPSLPNQARGQRLLPPSMTPTATDETLLIGGGVAPRFREPGPPGALLVGIEIGMGHFVGNSVLNAARPIFLKDGQESRGTWHAVNPANTTTEIIAKPGYAVGGISAEAHLVVTAMAVTFMRINGDELDPNDKYESPWFGTRGVNGARPWSYMSDGRPMVGLIGREKNRKCMGIGFLLGGK